MKRWRWRELIPGRKALETKLLAQLVSERRESVPDLRSTCWVCEAHPDQPMGHDGCSGAGMLPPR